MELIQCSELSSRLTDLNKIQEHITPEGHSWPRARVGSHVPTFPPRLPQEVVTLPAPHRQVRHDTQNQQRGARFPEGLGGVLQPCPDPPLGQPHRPDGIWCKVWWSPSAPRPPRTQLVPAPKGLAPMGAFPVGPGDDAGAMLGLDQDRNEHELEERETHGGSFHGKDRGDQMFCINLP